MRHGALLIACGALLHAAVLVGAEDPPGPLYAPHREADGTFFNPWERMPVRGLRDMLRWWLLDDNPHDKRRAPRVPRVVNDGAYLAGIAEQPSLTWVGHATFAIHEGDEVLLTDPHFTARALLPRRLQPPGLPAASIPDDALAVVSHSHYDHFDRGSVLALPESMDWFVPLGLGAFLQDWGRRNVVELDWWQSARHGDWTITCLPSQHWSLRFGQGRDETLWCSWLIDSGSHRYYFAGDTGYFEGFAEYGRRFGPIDVALLPIGGYEPRWFMRYQHLNPEEAFRAFEELRARYMIGMHWGTFDLTDEPLDLPPRVLAEIVARAGADPERVRTSAIGQRWRLPPRPERDPDEGLRQLADAALSR
jgi:N-acyl-phosphatidylethanolamine-hydrolysing phospholipase D